MPHTAFPGATRSLNLPIKETPEVPWDDLNDWANVNDFKQAGDADDTLAIQRAIDSGKTTVYFPNRGGPKLSEKFEEDKLDAPYVISDSIHIRGNVRRMIGCEAQFRAADAIRAKKDDPDSGEPQFIFEDGTQPVVVFERFHFGFQGKGRPPMLVNSNRTLVMSSVSDVSIRNTPQGNGELFLEDVGGGVSIFDHGIKVWMRQFNPEARMRPRFENHGATIWILGLKTEPGGPMFLARGGSTEILGAFQYTSHDKQMDTGMIAVEGDARVSVAAACEYVWTAKWAVDFPVSQTRDGQTKKIPKSAFARHADGSAMALFTANIPVAGAGAKPAK